MQLTSHQGSDQRASGDLLSDTFRLHSFQRKAPFIPLICAYQRPVLRAESQRCDCSVWVKKKYGHIKKDQTQCGFHLPKESWGLERDFK